MSLFVSSDDFCIENDDIFYQKSFLVLNTFATFAKTYTREMFPKTKIAKINTREFQKYFNREN